MTDTAGNDNVQTDSATVTIDRTAPVATIDLQDASDTGTSDSDNITKALSLTFDVTFDEDVFTLAASDFSNAGTATGCTFGAPMGSGDTYTVTVSTCSEGTVILRLAAAGVTDTAGNDNVQTDSATVTIDRTAPVVSAPDLDSASDTGVSAADNVTNDDNPDFSGSAEANAFVELLRDGSVVVSESAIGSAWSLTDIGPVADGPHTYTTRATDAAGNTSAESAGLLVVIDTVAPVATIDLQDASDTGTSDSDNITKALSLTFDVTFDEDVFTLAASDFSNAGTATGCTFGAPMVSGDTYTVTVSTCSEGTVILRLAAAGVTDTAGNDNVQTDSATVTIDRTAPVATIDLQDASDTGTSDSDNITKALSLTFDVTFYEDVFTLAASDFSNAGTATGCTFGAPMGSGDTYTVTVSTCSEGTVILRLAAAGVTDTAGNDNVQADRQRDGDHRSHRPAGWNPGPCRRKRLR